MLTLAPPASASAGVFCRGSTDSGRRGCPWRGGFVVGPHTWFTRLCWRLQVTYGSHMACHMAIGLLFLGGGAMSLGSSNGSIAALLTAFFPQFPANTMDNRYHLQALRHLYVLAAEPRALVTRDVTTGAVVYTPVTVEHVGAGGDDVPQTTQLVAPCLLPQLDTIRSVMVEGPRYWPVVHHVSKNGHNRSASQACLRNLFVLRRAGHLAYRDDRKGLKSLSADRDTVSGCTVTPLEAIGAGAAADSRPSRVLDDCSPLGAGIRLARSIASSRTAQTFSRVVCGASPERGRDEVVGIVQAGPPSDAYCFSVLQSCLADSKPESLATHLTVSTLVTGVRKCPTGPRCVVLQPQRLLASTNSLHATRHGARGMLTFSPVAHGTTPGALAAAFPKESGRAVPPDLGVAMMQLRFVVTYYAQAHAALSRPSADCAGDTPSSQVRGWLPSVPFASHPCAGGVRAKGRSVSHLWRLTLVVSRTLSLAPAAAFRPGPRRVHLGADASGLSGAHHALIRHRVPPAARPGWAMGTAHLRGCAVLWPSAAEPARPRPCHPRCRSRRRLPPCQAPAAAATGPRRRHAGARADRRPAPGPDGGGGLGRVRWATAPSSTPPLVAKDGPARLSPLPTRPSRRRCCRRRA